MKLGMFLPQGQTFGTREGILDGALAAEQIGYDSVWFWPAEPLEHPMQTGVLITLRRPSGWPIRRTRR